MNKLTSKEIGKQLRVLAAAQGLIAKMNIREAKAHTSYVIHLWPQAKNLQAMWGKSAFSPEYDAACRAFWVSVVQIKAEKWVPIQNLKEHRPPNFKPMLTEEDLTDTQLSCSTLRVVK